MRVLIVDDDKELCGCLRDILKMNHTVETLIEPKDIKTKDLSQFDAIVSDYLMDGMNGVEVLTYAKEQNKNIKTVLMSGGDPPDSSIYDIFLEKPASLFSLNEILNS